MIGIFKTVASTLFFLAYPFLVYKGIENGFVWLMPTVISGIIILQGIKAKETRQKIFKFVLALFLLLGTYYIQTITAKALPVLIQLMLMLLFGRTLFSGRPIIESFVRLEFSDIPPELLRYCRQLTWLWTGFFAFNAVVCIVLAIWGNDFWWALFNGVLIYVLIVLMTLGEYIYRHWRFPELDIPDPKSTIKSMIVNSPKVIMEARGD